MSTSTMLLLAALALGALWWWRSRRTIASEDGVNLVPTDDRDMQRAIAHARENFHFFAARLRDPQPGDENFSIKAGIRHEGEVEHIWLSDVSVDDDGFEGEIANEPRAVPFKIGERWRGGLDQLSDWAYFEHGRMQGNFTLRAMLPRMPKAEREQARQMLEQRWDTRELVHLAWPRDAAMPGSPRSDAISSGDEKLIQRIQEHFDAYLGSLPQVFHEAVSPSAHIDLYPYPADARRNFHVVASTGMAEKPMQLPDGSDADAYAELLLLLPRTWPLDYDAWQDERHWWPLRWMKRVARFHYESGHWLGEGHLLTHGNPPTIIHPDVPYDSVVLAAPRALPEGLGRTTLKDGRAVRLLCLYFLTAGEREALQELGWERYADRIRPSRLSV